MYPNPQDVLPLPPHPSLEQYRKQAKDLVKACRSGEPGAIRAWVARWLEALAESQAEMYRDSELQRRADQVEKFAQSKLHDQQSPHCALTDAQFVIARVQGFESWPKFVKHVEGLEGSRAEVSAFEAAAEAIVLGDADALERLLRGQPQLIRARSTREHRATLLHYVSGNGVENYRQQTPRNAVTITRMLLDAGAEVDAEADVYGGGATTLGLVATSVHPFKAGLQNDLIDLLLDRGARLDDRDSAGGRHGLVNACFANGRPESAEHLARRGAPLDLAAAAGLGWLDVISGFFTDDANVNTPTRAQMTSAFAWACTYGRAQVVEFLLSRGIEADRRLDVHGRRHTGLHVAAVHARVETVKALLQRGASVEVTDETWGTTPLVWALHGWSTEPTAEPERYYEVVALLVAAGATVNEDWFESDWLRADAKMRAALTAQA